MKFGVCRAIMGVNSTTDVKYYKGSNTLPTPVVELIGMKTNIKLKLFI